MLSSKINEMFIIRVKGKKSIFSLSDLIPIFQSVNFNNKIDERKKLLRIRFTLVQYHYGPKDVN